VCGFHEQCKNQILQACEQARRKNVLRDIESYNDEMTVSQAARFFERQGVALTKTMIQNYIRVGVLPPPKDKRRYTQDHLAPLAIIEDLKGQYSLEEIKAAFALIFHGESVNAKKIYAGYMTLCETALEEFIRELPGLLEKARGVTGDLELREEEQERFFYGVTILTLMAQSAALKQITRRLMETMDDSRL
jgi:DNA-binding transcriptional MerR regulator